MQNVSRRWLLTCLGVASTAGCLEGNPDRRDQTTKQTTTRSSPEPTDPATEQRQTQTDANPEADHVIRLTNDGSRTRRITVRINRTEDGTTVFETTADVGSDERKAVYNLRKANPLGVEAFKVHAWVIGTTTTDKNSTVTDTTHSTGTNSTDPTTCTEQDTTPSGPCYSSAYVETNECYGDLTIVWYGSSLGTVFTSIC